MNAKMDADLKKYCEGVANSEKKFSLLNFLDDVGLPAQTIGLAAFNSQNALKHLSTPELKTCHDLMMKLKEKMTSKKAGKNLMDIFEN